MKNTLWILLSITLFSGCAGQGDSSITAPDEYAIVYKSTEAIQCQFEGNPPETTAQELIDNGIDVLGSECGFITGTEVPSVCGIGDLSINIHTIHVQNLDIAIDLGFTDVASLPEEQGYEITECD